MTTPALTGFLTRPEASRLYNRSQRALERDLDAALRSRDAKLLAHWKLRTKDGATKRADEVDTETVKTLQAAGQVPVWYVSEAHLEHEFGRRGSPKPGRSETSTVGGGETAPRKPRSETAGRPTHESDVKKHNLPDDVEFLKDRIRTLEREKQAEVERNEKREAKLFAELDVKNRQISAWDEISQGLTKALATGQLAPALATGSPSSSSEEQRSDDSDAPIVEAESPKPPPAKADKHRRGRTATNRRQGGTRRSKKKPRSTKSTKKVVKKPSLLHRDIREFLPFRRR